MKSNRKGKILRLLALMLALVMGLGSFAAFAEELPAGEPGESDVVDPQGQFPSMFFLPDNMRGVIISPEVDFLLSPDDDELSVTSQLFDIFAQIADIGLNSVLIKTTVEDRVYHDLDVNKNDRFDLTKLAVDLAKAQYLGVYLIYDIGHAVNSEADSATAINTLVSEAHRLAIKYQCDGIILDNYYSDLEVKNYRNYMQNGSGIGYENWLHDSTEYLFETAGAVIRMTDNTLPVGVMINNTHAVSQNDGFADTRRYIEQGYADFITLRCPGSLTDSVQPFAQSAQFWGELCKASDIPMYLIHYNEKMGTAGWPDDQLLRQLEVAKKDISAFSGSVFNSYSSLKANPLNSTVNLKKYYADLINEDTLFDNLIIHSPRNTSFTTYEPSVSFMGSFDPNFDVFLNNSKITLNEAGNFYFEKTLNIGMNTFTLTHKGQTVTYRVDHRIIVMREIDDSIADRRTLRVDGGTFVTLQAIAYKGATVTATLNGRTVRLTEQSGIVLDDSVGSAYTSFTGRIKVPDGIISKEQPLGKISVQASFMGQSRTLPGATVIVNALPEPPKQESGHEMFDQSKAGTGEIVGRIGAVRGRNESVTYVRLLNNNTHTFDAKTTGTVFDPRFGQLPAGTVDYLRSEVGGFYTTESGKRFNAEGAVLASGRGIGPNALVVERSGTLGGNSYFEFKLGTRISYNVEVAGITFHTNWGSEFNVSNFNPEFVFVTFDNVTSVTKLPDFDSNFVFSSGTWEQVTIDGIRKFRLVLQLRQRGVYAGNSAYYNNDGNLMLTFPVLRNTLAGKTIVIDPGHGITASGSLDPGAIGEIREWDANLAISRKVEERLKALGANVIRLQTESVHIPARERPIEARKLGADMYISIHNNWASGGTARGTEAFYYTPFSQPLAEAISASVARYFTNNVYTDKSDRNRGAKNSYFWVTVQQDFPSVLLELGFVNNLQDAMALASDRHQNGIADAIVQGIRTYLSRSTIAYSADGFSGIPDNLQPEGSNGSSDNGENGDE
jgi:N-acetylmuramoyl-L-alanine amidase